MFTDSLIRALPKTDLHVHLDGSLREQSLIELADTLPAFHSNATLIPGSGLPDTVEGAVSFYLTPEFQTSPPGVAGGMRRRSRSI